MHKDLFKIPQYLDAPDKMFFIYTDELILGCIAFFAFYILMNLGIGMLALVISIRLRRKYRKTRWANIFQSFIYWYFPTSKKFTGLPPSFMREFL